MHVIEMHNNHFFLKGLWNMVDVANCRTEYKVTKNVKNLSEVIVITS